jgi:predicted ATPase/class 3 adenylate cyclase/DNA-binding CsgD family transcriptional regulator
MTAAPTGTVTFLFTDIEGSTRLWEDHPADMHTALSLHDAILRTEFERFGHVFATGGDGFAVVFSRPQDAIDAAVHAQQALAAQRWPRGVPLTVRMGLDTGAAYERGGDYFGPVPNRAARIMAAAHGGQILVSTRTASLVEVLPSIELIDVGDHRLKDLERAERLFQVRVEGLPTDFPPPRSQSAFRGNLPTPTANLIGRSGVLAEVVDLVRANRLVTLTGVGGVGKTRLALEVGADLASELPDGVWLVELASVVDSTAVPDAIATAMGVTPQAGVPVMHTVADVLSGRRLLLVLDNCEHVLDAAAEAVESLLARCSTVRVLATSRESLQLAGERRRLVLPLALEGDSASPAVMLFVERARAISSRIDFHEPETAAAVIEICRRLDGLPLGIELAAARTTSMSPTDMRNRLNDRFRILKSSTRTPRRQQSLRDVVSWSYELLNDDERAVLRCASVFAGGFDVAAITEVLGSSDEVEVLDLIDSLVHKSLVITDHATGSARYLLLETIRQFAEDELAATGTLDVVRDRHAAFFARTAVAQWERWNGPAWRECVDWVEVELANLRAAFRWSADRPDPETAADIAAHSALMGVSVQLFETVGWAQEILDAATLADVRRLPRVYTAAAWGCFTGGPEQAVLAAQMAARLETDPRYEPCEAGLSGLIEALAQVYAGHLDRYVEVATKLVTLPGNARAWGLSLLLDGLQATGRVDEAIELTNESVPAARALGNPYFIAYALWTCGGAYANTDPAHALAVWREALDYVQLHRVNFFVGFIARDAARQRLVDADPDDALTMFDAAIESFQQAGNVAQLTITLASATTLFERIERREEAATLYGAIARQAGSEHHVPDLPELAGRLATTLGDETFHQHETRGAAMDLNDAAHYARQQIQLALAQLGAQVATRQSRAGGLSPREIDVLRLAAQGLTTREIAAQLFISAKTADRHLQNLYTKIGVSNRAGATLWAAQHQLID